MLLTKFVKVKVNNHSMSHYKSLGYNVKMFDEIQVPVEDLTPKSTVKVSVKCDYCGAEYNITYSCYTRNVSLDKSLGKPRTDACVHCRHLKAKDTFKERYNIDNPMQSQDIRDKARATNIQRYGCENPILNKEINGKRIKTLIERYGEDNPMKVDEFAKKQMESMQGDNGLYSYCQKYLADLYNGVINHRIGKYLFDIYVESDKLDIEINGSGHNLDVVLGKMTQEQFNTKEKNRIDTIRDNGFYQIIFVLDKDKLPENDILERLKDFALVKFNDGWKVIYFYCDRGYIILDNEVIKYNYKDLIKNIAS